MYLYEKHATATDDADWKTACTETFGKCDFYIVKASKCFLGDFERGEKTVSEDADIAALAQPVDIKLKKG